MAASRAGTRPRDSGMEPPRWEKPHVMQQLSGLDNAFLVMETGGQLGHIASVSLFDTAGATEGSFYQAIRRTLEERLHLLPPYRRRLVEIPLELDRPYWIEDPDFDLDFHLRHIAVPPPGDDGQLAQLISRLHSRALDRAKPLWEVYVIEGLEGGRAALYSKIHHCTVDGVSGAEMTQVLLDHDPEGDPVPPDEEGWRPEPVPPSTEMLTRGLLGLATSPGRFARSLYRTARAVWENNEALGAIAQTTGLDKLPFAGGWLQTTGPEVDADRVPQNPAPRTPFNRVITPHRRFAFFSLPLAEFKHVKNAFGTSLNDVVMAVTGSALRRYLDERHALPEHPLVAMVPVSVRAENQVRDYTNRVTQVLAELATDAADPVERLQRIHAAMSEAKRMQRATPATLLTDWDRGGGACPLRPGRPHRGAHEDHGPPEPALQRDHLERARPARIALLRGLRDADLLPRLGHRRRSGPERHRHQLPRPPRLRTDHLPRARSRRVEVQGVLRREPRRAGQGRRIGGCSLDPEAANLPRCSRACSTPTSPASRAR